MVDWEEIRRRYATTAVTLRALAEEHGVNYSTLRGRASRGKWTKQDNARDTPASTARSKTTQPIALPQGAAPGNIHAVVTGEHQSAYPMTDEEREWLDARTTDPLHILDDQITVCDLRIRRMLALRMEAEDTLARLDEEVEVSQGVNMGQDVDLVVTRRRSQLERLARIEDAITRVQGQMRQLVAEKRKALAEEKGGGRARSALADLMQRLREEGDDAEPSEGQTGT